MSLPGGKCACVTALIGLLALIQTEAWGASATTGLGFIACREEQWLDDIFEVMANADTKGFDAMLETEKCLVVEENLVVTLTPSYSDNSDTVEYIHDGVHYWTIKEALHSVTQ
ncbi:MAG: hypothetical protein OEU36_10890, partial [Gammaproteobacteria bacterium]|nr:hypothetical protein [Gammaproteobacteria bacterium]